nr:MAG TPA: minor tail protein [Caudoviricetes sp.]
MADLNLQVRLRALDEMSRTFRNIGAANSRLMRTFDQNRNALRRLNDQLRNVEAYRRQQESMRQTADNIERMRNRMQRLQQQMGGLRHGAQRWRELASQFDRASRDLARLENVQNREQQRLLQLTQRLREAGINTRQLAQEEARLRNNASRTNTELERQAQRLQRIAERHQRNERRLQTAANASMAGYVGINTAQRAGHLIASPVREYMQQEQASTDLKVTMMRADGSLGAFEEINKQAKQLGNVLPGTTQDFINLAKSLKEQGVKDEVLTSGGLKAAAELAVLMNMGQEEGGTFTARMIEAHGLNPDDLNKAADMTQRAYFAFGLKKEDMGEAMKYYAPNVNALGLTGEANYRKLLAIQGMAARQGLEGSMFGTNFSMMLSKLGEGPKALEMAKKGMKGEARDVLKKAGVKFNFYNKDGTLKDIESIVKELEKFDVVRKKLGDEEALLAMRQMFGEQGGRVAKILAQQGVEGLTQALADMDEQADKTMRITEKTSTLSAAFEQLEGVATLLSGTIGETLRDSLLWLSNNLQDFIENTLQPFVNNNKELVKWLMVGAAGLIALAAVGGTLLLVFAGLNAMWVMGRFAIGGLLANLGLLGRLFTSFAGFAAVAGKAALSGLATAVMWLGRAFLIAGRFMLANPIVLVIAAVVAAGWWLYKNWGNVIGFLKDRWAALKNWWLTNPVSSAIIGAFSAAIEFCVNLPGQLWDLLTGAGTRAIEAIRNWSVLQAIMDIFGPAIDWATNKINWLIDKIKGAWESLKGLVGAAEEGSILENKQVAAQVEGSRPLGGSTSSQTTRGDAYKRHA